MRRITLLAALATLAGCDDDGAASSPAPGTVAIGALPGTLPPPSTVATTAPPTTTPTTADAGATAVSPGASTLLTSELNALFDGATAPPPPMDLLGDDAGRLRILVPTDWADRRTTPAVAASTDLVGFFDGYDEPGVTAVNVDGSPLEALRAYDFGEDCERVQQGEYETASMQGEYRAWRRCGGTETAIVTVGVETDDGDTVVVLAQLLGPADLAALDVTLESLGTS